MKLSLRKRVLGTLLILFSLILVACGSSSDTITIGVVGENNEQWDYVIDQLADQGINAELVIFSDYNQPNQALLNGEIDLNSYQHHLFLDTYNEDQGSNLQPIAETVYAPLGIYSSNYSNLDELQEGDTVTIPNDASNGGRALHLLQEVGLIELDSEDVVGSTAENIVSNPLNLQIEPLDASQTARSLPDVGIAVVNSGMATDAGLNPLEDAIATEELNEDTQQFVNVIVANEDVNPEDYQAVIDTFQSDGTAQVIKETYQGAQIPAWELDEN